MTETTKSGREIWLYALWFGIVMSLGESALFFAWQRAGEIMYISADIVWATMLFDTIVCLAIACVFVLLVRYLPALRAAVPIVFFFVLYLNWAAVGLHDRIHTAVLPILAAGLAIATTGWLRRKEGRVLRLISGTLPFVGLIAVGSSAAVVLFETVGERRAIAALPSAAAGSPNVLVLVLDTFRADHSSAYGYERETTPRIDALARDGVLFERAFSTASYTLASHASILTGLYPHEHGAQWRDALGFRDCECLTLGGALRNLGYVTGGFSSNPFYFTREYGFGRGFLHFEDYFDSLEDSFFRTTFGRAIEQLVLPRLGYRDIPGRKRAAFVNEEVLGWIDDHGDRPFFAFVNYFDTHDPYLPPEPYRSRYAGRSVGGVINWRINGLDPRLEESVLKDEIDAYDGAVTYLDAEVGALLDSLQARDELGNTIVVITSDHGEAFGEHGHVLHGHSLYVPTIHVPLIVWSPGRVRSDVRIVRPVSNAAIPSTIMDLITDADDLFPLESLLADSAESPPVAPALSELVRKPWGPESFPTYHGAMQSIVDGRWHYIRHDVFESQLYDLEADFGERRNLAGDAAHAGIIEALDLRIDDLWNGANQSHR